MFKNKRWYFLLLPVCLCLLSTMGYAQNKVSGTVVDNKGEPLLGVNVVVKGNAAVGTATDMDGKYNLTVPATNAVLQFSYLGFVEQEVPVGSKTQINVTLLEDTKKLDEVVVVGYGTMRKKDLTGSVVQIRPEKIAAENPKTVQDVLRGTAGIAITNDPSAKGGGDIQIRGQRSVYTAGGHNNALIVLDGMIFPGDLSEISPTDIAQIDVLKDASAAAIYGAQAANGVIIVTTKKGTAGKSVVNISVDLGATSKSDYRKVWSPDQYLQHRVDYNKAATYGMNPATGNYEAYQIGTTKMGFYDNPNNLANMGVDLDTWRNYGTFATGESDLSIWAKRIGLDLDNSHMVLNNFLAGKIFDWYNHTFQTGFNQNYNANISGANDRMNYYLSFGYTKNVGAVTGDVFNNIRANMKVQGKVLDWLEIGANVNFQKRNDPDNNMMPNLDPNNYNINQNQIRNSPYGSYRNDDGTLTEFPDGMGNFKGRNFDYTNQFQAIDKGYYILNPNFNAKITLPFGFSYSFNAQPRFQWFHDYFWQSSQNPDWVSTNGYVYRESMWKFDWLLNNQIAWEKTFAKVHRFSATLAQEAGRQQSWQDYINARGFSPSDVLGFHNTINSDKDKSDYNTNDTQQSSNSYIGRLFYSYNDLYMLTATIRRDGYSAFGSSNPYATFPSLSGAWTFTNEKFFHFEPMNYGKLRVSWGKNGNRSLNDPYVALANLQTGGTLMYGYISSGALVNFNYLQISRMANPNLKWETSAAWNFGLDFGFLKNRLSGSFEYYNISTNNMIMLQTLVGFAGFNNMTTNLGEVNNKGVEISLTSTNIKTPTVEWNTTVNFAYNQNKIVHLYYTYDDVLDANGNVIGRKEQDDIANGWFIGHPIDEIWDFKQTGIWQTKDYDVAKNDYNQRPGDPIVWKNPNNPLQKGDNGFYNYDNNDKVFLGPRTPPINISMRNDVTFFKNLTLTFNIYSRWGGKFASTEYMNDDNNSNALIQGSNAYTKTYWTIENPSNQYARIQAQGPTGANTPPKIFDRSFIRFDNLSLSYSLPKRWIQKLAMEKLSITGSVRNLGVWCKNWPYGDPETLGGDANTMNYDSYNTNNNGLQGLATRTYTVGINVTF